MIRDIWLRLVCFVRGHEWTTLVKCDAPGFGLRECHKCGFWEHL